MFVDLGFSIEYTAKSGRASLHGVGDKIQFSVSVMIWPAADSQLHRSLAVVL
jgi:hypothetical protein